MPLSKRTSRKMEQRSHAPPPSVWSAHHTSATASLDQRLHPPNQRGCRRSLIRLQPSSLDLNTRKQRHRHQQCPSPRQSTAFTPARPRFHYRLSVTKSTTARPRWLLHQRRSSRMSPRTTMRRRLPPSPKTLSAKHPHLSLLMPTAKTNASAGAKQLTRQTRPPPRKRGVDRTTKHRLARSVEMARLSRGLHHPVQRRSLPSSSEAGTRTAPTVRRRRAESRQLARMAKEARSVETRSRAARIPRRRYRNPRATTMWMTPRSPR